MFQLAVRLRAELPSLSGKLYLSAFIISLKRCMAVCIVSKTTSELASGYRLQMERYIFKGCIVGLELSGGAKRVD